MVGLLALTAAPARAVGPVDQSQTQTAFGLVVPAEPALIAQSFPAGVTGNLDQVSLALKRLADTTEPVTVEIRPLNAGVPTDTILASTSVPADQIPVSQGDDGQADLLAIPIGPVPVTAGTEYAIVLSHPTAGARIFSGFPNPYDGGNVLETDDGTEWFFDNFYDFGFQTFVTPAPPPPSDGVLSGLLTAIGNSEPLLQSIVDPVRDLLRGLGL